jgi:hypothetical protein
MSASTTLRWLISAATLLILGCSTSDSQKDADISTSGQDTILGSDTFLPGEIVDREANEQPIDIQLPPDLPKAELPPPTGDKDLGEECLQDGDCLSQLCYSTESASGCTLECTKQVDCQLYGLICLPLRPGLAACIPPPPVQLPCANHADCTYPTTCVDQYGWCDLPECTLDGDCPDGQECEPGTRECQPTACESTYECASPVDFCLDGTCGPPDCDERSDCAPEQICSYAQGICDDAQPCNEEGACNWYNQACVDGLCEPNLCATPCSNEAHACHPKTGKCGAPCSTPDGCPTGWSCDVAASVCYENIPPVALAQALGKEGAGSEVLADFGGTIQLDGNGSLDPEGLPLTYRWMLLSAPPGATQASGTIFCQQPTCNIGPLAWGLYRIGLWVQDSAGGWSAQSQATILVL